MLMFNVKYLYWLHDHISYCHASHKVKLGELHKAHEPRNEEHCSNVMKQWRHMIYNIIFIVFTLIIGSENM